MRRGTWKRSLFAAAFLAFWLAGAGGQAFAAEDSTDRFVDGTVINGLGVTGMTAEAVSYTHLDVYKRQGCHRAGACENAAGAFAGRAAFQPGREAQAPDTGGNPENPAGYRHHHGFCDPRPGGGHEYF